MNTIVNNEKVAFCITCMNRLKHLQQTIEQNIQDNFLKEKVEFILLDYNSKDGLEKWVYNNMRKYIDEETLVYYKTTEPTYYLRSHSRNVAFRLANATILCNLDADNFLGKGFSNFLLEKFSNYNKIFITNSSLVRDTFGRISIRNEDFFSIRGYNEALHGYGDEDSDIQNRLMQKGLKPIIFNNPKFYNFISHSNSERISEETMFKNLYEMYITYVNPYTSGVLLLNKDYSLEQYTLIAKGQLNVLIEFSSVYDCFSNDKDRTVLQDDVVKGTWSEDCKKIYIQNNFTSYQICKKLPIINLGDTVFYRVQNDEVKAKIIILLSDAINYKEAIKQIKNKLVINPEGFGKGIVYKNFNLSKKIILS